MNTCHGPNCARPCKARARSTSCKSQPTPSPNARAAPHTESRSIGGGAVPPHHIQQQWRWLNRKQRTVAGQPHERLRRHGYARVRAAHGFPLHNVGSAYGAGVVGPTHVRAHARARVPHLHARPWRNIKHIAGKLHKYLTRHASCGNHA